MTFFLRYTATPEKDIERGTSLNLCDHADESEDAVFIKELNSWAVILDGLCAHSVDAGNESDAIEETIESVLWARKHSGASGNYPEGDGYAAWLFEGEESDGDCDDGVLFIPKRLVANISDLAE